MAAEQNKIKGAVSYAVFFVALLLFAFVNIFITDIYTAKGSAKSVTPVYPVNIFAKNSNKKSQKTSRKKKLDNLNKSIKQTRIKISRLSTKEKSEIKALNTYQKHISNVKKYIRLLDDELHSLQDSIRYLSTLFRIAGRSRNHIKKEYTKVARLFYLTGKMEPDEFIILKKDYARQQRHKIYFDWLGSHLANKEKEISRFMDSTQIIVRLLYDNTLRQEELKNLKEGEKIKLSRTVISKRNLLKKIRQDKKLLNKQLEQKKRSAKSLKRIIAGLTKKGKYSSKLKALPKKLPVGKLSWPTKSRKILRKFGAYKNPSTNTVFDNPGIDISAINGSAVVAAADGTVSLVHWLPGYGSLIIIDHGSDIRTVYANLSSVLISKGDKISTGSIIGKTGESVDGEHLHFELWQGSRRLNPLDYLK